MSLIFRRNGQASFKYDRGICSNTLEIRERQPPCVKSSNRSSRRGGGGHSMSWPWEEKYKVDRLSEQGRVARLERRRLWGQGVIKEGGGLS